MKPPLGCEEVLARMFAYLDGELERASEEEVDRHLAACRGCLGRARFERRLRARLAEAVETRAPDSLRQRIQLMLERP